MYSNTITYRPSQLFYSQDSIKHTFKDGLPLDESLSDLLKSPTPQQRLPPVEVMVYDGKPFVIDGNRRLFLLKKLENVGLVGSIKVVTTPYNSYRFRNKYTTHNEGLSIRIRNDRYMELKIDKIIKTHKREKYHDQSPRNPSADINARYMGFTSPIGASQRYYGEASQSKLERNSTTRPELSIYGGMASRINPAPGTQVSGFASPIGASQRYYGAASQPKLERNSTTRPELSVYSENHRNARLQQLVASERTAKADERKRKSGRCIII